MAEAGRKVLVVEDDPSVTSFVAMLLTEEGYDVEVAEDGLVGLVKLHAKRPDAAVVDIMMPDVDGLRVLEQLREEGGGEIGVPIVVITGSPEGAARCRELLDPADVLEKPFDPDDLLGRLAHHLGGEGT